MLGKNMPRTFRLFLIASKFPSMSRASMATYNPPLFKESLYYREVFNKYYKGRDDILPHYWLPKWSGNLIEPSARILNVYSDNKQYKLDKQDVLEFLDNIQDAINNNIETYNIESMILEFKDRIN